MCWWPMDTLAGASIIGRPNMHPDHGDIGSTPRLIGSYHAIGLGVDAVAFLDADNWYGQTTSLICLRGWMNIEPTSSPLAALSAAWTER